MKVDLKSIKIDPELYPRYQIDWHVVLSYMQAMKVGAKFPNIVVARWKDKLYLVDGAHRLNSKLKLGMQYDDCTVIPVKTREKIYVEAVRRNVINGKPLAYSEKLEAIAKLKSYNFEISEISKIVMMEATTIERNVATRIVPVIGGDSAVLRGPLKSMENLVIDNKNEFYNEQKILTTDNTERLVSELIKMAKNEWINYSNMALRNSLIELVSLLNAGIEKEELHEGKV